MRLRRMPRHDQLNLFQARPTRVTWTELPERARQETQILLTRLFTQFLRHPAGGAGKGVSDER